jgi:hypothetical protein
MKPLPGRTVVAAPGHPVQNRPGGNQFPSSQGNQEQKPNAPNTPYPGSGPRAYPVGPARETERPINPQTGNPKENPNYQQPGPPNQPNYQQPARQDYQQPNQPNYQQQGRPSPQPVTQERPTQPPPPSRSAEEPKVKQEFGPQQQSKPNDASKQNSNKDQKKSDKKDDKKDEKKHD